MSAPKSKTTKELLAAAKLPERSVTICLRGDIVADIENLTRDLKDALEERSTNGRLGSKSKAKELADQIEAKRAEMGESTLTFRLRALKPATWREMIRRYPTKDEGLAVDLLAFMGEAIPASTVSPDDLDEDDWNALNDRTAPAEMGRLMDAVWELNTQGVNVPKSPLASAVNRRSADA